MRTVFALLLLVVPACGSPGPADHVAVDVPSAERPDASALIARDVGWLLSADAARSRVAMERLTRLDEDGKAALAAHAARIPKERDPRWLLVLDENHALPPLEVEEEVEYLLWKVEQGEPFYVMKAQNRLLELAGRAPDRLVRRLEQGGPGTEALAVALAVRGEGRSVPALLERYRGAETVAERRAAAEALGYVVGDELRPRAQGAPEELEEDARRIERWVQQQGADRDD